MGSCEKTGKLSKNAASDSKRAFIGRIGLLKQENRKFCSVKKACFQQLGIYFYSMFIFKKVLLCLSWLSIDVVIGATAGMYYFAEVLHVQLDWPPYFLLSLAVWCIYNLDHILDSQSQPDLNSPRRQFHHRNRKTLVFILAILTVLGVFGGIWWFGWGKNYNSPWDSVC